ncbi:GNAT family N-acetyltransferase [Nostoc favosum]|uniref:GNAT family N-acetyltransferase n=1 Tax=Nostoc favosum CHAB5714 TaxID=2780399 RepID=A0ABS8IF18_9NOSO|nr:GNAT family N-acetyltransferase [Nostoc favosum]MCC5602828.1 GNAT family N-acetyltransferase [Nostoc favosum CHAB5714]
MKFSIEEITDRKGEIAEGILRLLPDWFGLESGIIEYCREVNELPLFAAVTQTDAVVGFLSLKEHNEFSGEIYVMAVAPEYHRHGIGKALLEYSLEHCRNRGLEFLQVKTLGLSCPDSFFDCTRKFYFKVGFRPLEEFTSIWSDNPCLIMVMAL